MVVNNLNIQPFNFQIILRTLFFILLFFTNLFSFADSLKTNSIVILGDTQRRGLWEKFFWEYWGEDNENKTIRILNEISENNPEIIFHLGDITSDGSSEKEWKFFENAAKSIISKNIMMYPVLGNHEYFGDNEVMFKNLRKRFNLINPLGWYRLDVGNVRFIILNSNFNEIEKVRREEQKSWFNCEINGAEIDKKIEHIIVLSHHPPFTNSKIVKHNLTLQKQFVPKFLESKKCKLFFSGHCHSYERFEFNGKTFIVSGGGGGARQRLNINKEKRKYDDKFNGPEKRFFHFCKLTLSESKILLEVIKLNDMNNPETVEKIIIE